MFIRVEEFIFKGDLYPMTNTLIDRNYTPNKPSMNPAEDDMDSQRFKVLSQTEEKFILVNRYVVWIGENEDLDYDNEQDAEKRLHDLLHSGLPREDLSVKAYWYVSSGNDDDYIIARRYTDYTDAEEALAKAKMRWFNQQMDQKSIV
jgi:hypothetical protein